MNIDYTDRRRSITLQLPAIFPDQVARHKFPAHDNLRISPQPDERCIFASGTVFATERLSIAHKSAVHCIR
jgi:hypothetical protein